MATSSASLVSNESLRGQEALAALREAGYLAAPHELAAMIDDSARALGARRGIAYLADLQQHVLVPFVGPSGPGDDAQLTPLSVDTTLAGRAFQTFDVQVHNAGSDGTRAWFPMLVGTDRIGVLSITLGDGADALDPGGAAQGLFARLASTAAGLLVSKSPYGDTLVRLRRQTEIGLAAEIQYSLLPPLTFASKPVTIAAALEPCYSVAGDTIDYAVDADATRLAVFDGMGHGLQSAQCSVLTVAAYRNARRAGLSLTDTMRTLDEALRDNLGGEVFTTAVLVELDAATGLLQWANAGHPEPLLLRDGQVVKTLHVDPRPPLGLGDLDGAEAILTGSEQLQPGDRLLLYTDGVVEARSPSGQFFGIDRLSDLVLRHLAGGLPAPETIRRAVRELLDHQQDQLSDDASIVLLEWRSGNEDALLA